MSDGALLHYEPVPNTAWLLSPNWANSAQTVPMARYLVKRIVNASKQYEKE
jgi:hypothetical protein